MLRRILILALISFFVIAAKGGVFAEEIMQWDPPSAGPVSTWTAPLCGKGEFVMQPFFFYNKTRGSFDSDGHYDSLPDGDKKYQRQEQLFMQYGLTDRLEIDAQTVYQSNYAKQGGVKAHASGFGDSYLFLRYCALEENGWLPHATGLFQLKIPTGKYQHLDAGKLETDAMGAGSWDPGFGIILTKKLKPFIFHADVLYSLPQQVRIDGAKTRYANYLNYDFGLEYFLPRGFNLMFEVNGLLQGDTKYLTLAPGIGWSNDKIQTLLAYQRVVVGKNTDANDSVVLTYVYTF